MLAKANENASGTHKKTRGSAQKLAGARGRFAEVRGISRKPAGNRMSLLGVDAARGNLRKLAEARRAHGSRRGLAGARGGARKFKGICGGPWRLAGARGDPRGFAGIRWGLLGPASIYYNLQYVVKNACAEASNKNKPAEIRGSRRMRSSFRGTSREFPDARGNSWMLARARSKFAESRGGSPNLCEFARARGSPREPAEAYGTSRGLAEARGNPRSVETS